jgi:hypothetical protein
MLEVIRGEKPEVVPVAMKDVVGPIGTLVELLEVGGNPKLTQTCSVPTGPQAGGNKGCPWGEKHCRFHPWRNQSNGLKGPLNVGVEIMLSRDDGGAHNQMQMSCFDYYAANMHRRKSAGEHSGELVRIVAYEGDGKMIREYESRAIDPKATVVGGSKEIVRYINEHPVWPFPRPKERFPMEVGREQSKQEIMDEVEREALANVLNRPLPEARPVEVIGAGRKVIKSGTEA